VAVGKDDGVDGVNHGLPLPTAILCQLPGSRQSQAVGKSCFADCRKFQLAKGPLCRVSKKNSWQRKLQSAKSQFPVVMVFQLHEFWSFINGLCRSFYLEQDSTVTRRGEH
jgi:hypothetical protein